MSAVKYRYEVVASDGEVLARYKTLAQALLGATWRSRQLVSKVWIWRADGKSIRFVAMIQSRA